MKTHRTLLIKRPLRIFDEDERNALIRILSRVDALGNLWTRGFAVYPPDLSPKFAYEFDYFRGDISFGNGVDLPRAWFVRVHAMLGVGLRVNNERDRSEGVFIDLTSNTLRLRGIIKGRAITIDLTPSEVKYIRERLSEGGKPRLARAWVENGFLYVAIVFEREVQPMQPSEYRLVIDVNSWRNGIVWALIRDGKIVAQGRERPRLGFINELYERTIKLSRKYGRLKMMGLHKSIEGRKLWREIKRLKRRLYNVIRNHTQWLVYRLVRKALKHKALVIIDDVIEESRRELLEEGLSSGLAKLYLAYLRRFVKLLTNQLEWYGVPYQFKRLPSTVCPVCRHELRQLPGRVMVCDHCGFKANRDYVPIQWAIKLITENNHTPKTINTKPQHPFSSTY